MTLCKPTAVFRATYVPTPGSRGGENESSLTAYTISLNNTCSNIWATLHNQNVLLKQTFYLRKLFLNKGPYFRLPPRLYQRQFVQNQSLPPDAPCNTTFLLISSCISVSLILSKRSGFTPKLEMSSWRNEHTPWHILASLVC